MPLRFSLPFRTSLPAKLALFALIFITAVVAVHVLSLDSLVHVSGASSEVRNRWLDSISYLGHIERRISDVRTQEAEILLPGDPATRETRAAELPQLFDEVTKAIDQYKALPRDADETPIFNMFLQNWNEHVKNAQAVTSLSQTGQGDAAVALLQGTPTSTGRAARSELRRLMDLTEAKAARARDTTAQSIADAQRWISDLIVGVGALFVILAAYLWWFVSRPLLELAGLMRRLSTHDTNFTIRFESWRNEIGEIARSLAVFRQNTIELKESRKRLSDQAEVLTRSLEKEQALAVEQRNFISTISHEFRTPLMAIDGNAQRLIITSERANPSQIADRAHKIRAAVFRMTSLVASLVNAVELSYGEMRARTRRFDLGGMLRDLTHYYSEIGLGGELQANIGQLPDEITGDPELLYQVFSNLISNAFKYSPENGMVTLTAGAKDGFVVVTVEDRGLGIPRDEIDRIRERYYRASNVGSIPGTGIGLNLVDEIVRRHGGQVEIESEEGKGTRIRVILPAEGPSGDPEHTREQDLIGRGRRRDSEPADGGSQRARRYG